MSNASTIFLDIPHCNSSKRLSPTYFSSEKRIKAIDFFCGAGGLTRGLLDSGIGVLAGVDNDRMLKQTYERNNTPSKFLHRNIKTIDIHKLRSDLGITPKDLVLYAACTPCQPFSSLTRLNGSDKRKSLLLAFARLVEEAPPDFIVVENVPGLSNEYGRAIYNKFVRTLKATGFNFKASLLDAKDYGVPQTRKRFILLASRHGEVLAPRKSAYPKTVSSAIKKYPRIGDGGKSNLYFNHEARKLAPHLKIIVSHVPKNGGSRSDILDHTILLKCHQKKPHVHKDVFGRMSWDEPAPTLTCRCTDVYCGRFIHPRQNRGISLREAAALQTFSDNYKFEGIFIHIAQQIGNAVPVELAKRLGRAIKRSARHAE